MFRAGASSYATVVAAQQPLVPALFTALQTVADENTDIVFQRAKLTYKVERKHKNLTALQAAGLQPKTLAKQLFGKRPFRVQGCPESAAQATAEKNIRAVLDSAVSSAFTEIVNCFSSIYDEQQSLLTEATAAAAPAVTAEYDRFVAAMPQAQRTDERLKATLDHVLTNMEALHQQLLTQLQGKIVRAPPPAQQQEEQQQQQEQQQGAPGAPDAAAAGAARAGAAADEDGQAMDADEFIGPLNQEGLLNQAPTMVEVQAMVAQMLADHTATSERKAKPKRPALTTSARQQQAKQSKQAQQQQRQQAQRVQPRKQPAQPQQQQQRRQQQRAADPLHRNRPGKQQQQQRQQHGAAGSRQGPFPKGPRHYGDPGARYAGPGNQAIYGPAIAAGPNGGSIAIWPTYGAGNMMPQWHPYGAPPPLYYH